MERAAGQVRAGQEKQTGRTPAQTVVTYPFTVPSTGEVLYTTKPEFANVAAFINLVMEQFPDAEKLTGQDRDVFHSTVNGKMLDYFTRYCVRITEKQRVPGLKAVAKAYKEAGLRKMPKGKELIGKIVLLGLAKTQQDRLALLAHFSELSGLLKFAPTEPKAEA